MAPEELRAAVLAALGGIIAPATDGVDAISITAFTVERGGACGAGEGEGEGGEGAGAERTGARGEFRTEVVFARADGVINPALVLAAPAVEAFEATQSRAIRLDDSFTPASLPPPGSPAPTARGPSAGGVVALVAAAAFAFAAGGAVYRRRRGYREQVAAGII